MPVHIVNDWGKGMYHGTAITDLPEGSVTLLRNMSIKQGRYIGSRFGYSKYSRSLIKVKNIAQPISGLAEYNYDGTKTLIATSRDKIYTYSPTTGVFTEVSGVSLTDGYKQHFTKFYDWLILSNGVDTPLAYDGTTWIEMSDSPLFTYAHPFYGNLFCWGITGGTGFTARPDRVHFSNDYVVDDFPLTYYHNVSDSKFDDIKSIKTVNDVLGAVVFSKDNSWTLSGTGHTSYRYDNLSYGIGAVSHETVQEKNGRLFWLDEDGFYTFDGNIPVRFRQLDSVFKTIDTSRLTNAWSVIYRGKAERSNQYWCGITLGTGKSSNNYLFIYDIDSNGWTFNTGLPCDMLCKGKDSNGYEIIYGVNNTDGYIYQLDDGENDNGKPINAAFIDMPRHFGEPNKNKLLKNILIWYRSKYTMNLNLKVTADYTGNTSPYDGSSRVITFTGEGNPPSQYEYDTLENTTHFLRYKHANFLRVTDMALRGQYFQLRIDCSAGNQDFDIYQIGFDYEPIGSKTD